MAQWMRMRGGPDLRCQVEHVGEFADVEQLDEQLRVVDVAVDGVHACRHQVRLHKDATSNYLLLWRLLGGSSAQAGDQTRLF